MQEKTFTVENKNFIIRRLKSVDDVVIFKVFRLMPSPRTLELTLLFGWVDKKLIELTPRLQENNKLLDIFSKHIVEFYHLKSA